MDEGRLHHRHCHEARGASQDGESSAGAWRCTIGQAPSGAAKQTRRYEKSSLVLTSSKSFVDWGEIFSNQVRTTTILDRLLHHATALNIKNESYRLKEKCKAGLLSSPAKLTEPEA